MKKSVFVKHEDLNHYRLLLHDIIREVLKERKKNKHDVLIFLSGECPFPRSLSGDDRDEEGCSSRRCLAATESGSDPPPAVATVCSPLDSDASSDLRVMDELTRKINIKTIRQLNPHSQDT